MDAPASARRDSARSRVVLVTGAHGAIGEATARAFLDAGFGVVGLDREPAVVEAVGAVGYRGVAVDLRDETALADALTAVPEVGPLSHVVGIAGGALPGEPETESDPAGIDPRLFRDSIEANLTTQFLVLRAALPLLRETDGDRSITLTSSWNALTGCGLPAYSAAKAGLIGMMHALVRPLGGEGIRINVVAPGTVRTPRTERLWSHDPGHFERLAATSPLGRLGVPDDVARAFVALARDLTHVTGHVLVVDGGQLHHLP
jgi:NAD(P)-dependent dehydrogenase (short-subunit alcohol dehydrogenase family)